VQQRLLEEVDNHDDRHAAILHHLVHDSGSADLDADDHHPTGDPDRCRRVRQPDVGDRLGDRRSVGRSPGGHLHGHELQDRERERDLGRSRDHAEERDTADHRGARAHRGHLERRGDGLLGDRL
jgi:hypothetical protein